MAKAKKLPSGSWRCQVFDHVDVDGKRHYKSFTAASKREAEFMANRWLAHGKDQDSFNITLYEAISRYIDSKRSVLSPSTIRGYVGLQKNYYKEIGTVKLTNLSNSQLQVWISDLSKRLSPKTIRNIYGLLVPVLTMFAPDFSLKVTLPTKTHADLYCPNDNDIKRLLEHIAGKELEIAVLLAAFGPMRRGEICALTSDDIHGNIVQVRNNMVLDENGEWVIKPPKTLGSCRDIQYPDFVIEKLKGIDGRIVKATPAQITNRFIRAITFSNSPHFRFHDLRHYSASIMHAIGIPDQYIMQRGGWATDHVMKAVYRDVIDLEAVKQNKKILRHFDKMQHEMQHEARKTR